MRSWRLVGTFSAEVDLLLVSLAFAWTNEDCVTCHPDVAARYATSRHAHAFDNLNFAAAWEHADHRSWCASCHLPRGRPPGCDTCHEDHAPVRQDVCQGCHTVSGFNVQPPLRFGGDLLQSTWDEWRQVTDRPCASCHLDGHRFAGGHDPVKVREGLQVDVTPGRLVVRTTEALGHRLPTGDPFRRLEVVLCADIACEEVVAKRTLGVLHEADAAGWPRITHDTRLGPPGSPWPDRVVLESPGARAYRVRLLLADPALRLPREERVLDLFDGALR